ncbi:MAG: transposase, partial [Verrucomicrobiae bacterium]|nr:transposase [Verrucomicrobiae bacterium]
MVTFRLADSFPESLRSEWKHLLEIEEDRQRRIQYEAYLDRGRGHCHLRRADIAGLVENQLRQFGGGSSGQPESITGKRYELRAWVIMPNHVHVLFQVAGASLSEIVGQWKRNTGRLANRRLGKSGAFWAEDYFDTYMRNAGHEQQAIRYIEHNPAKARLVLDP